jgi:hypothetical protein
VQNVFLEYVRPQGNITEQIMCDLLKPLSIATSMNMTDASSWLFQFSYSEGYSNVRKYYKSQIPDIGTILSQTVASIHESADGGDLELPFTDKYATTKLMAHESLFEPDLEYVSILYRPTIDFFQRLSTFARGYLFGPSLATYCETIAQGTHPSLPGQ